MRLLLVAATLCALSACKQPLGAHCQIDSDCEGDLVCSTADKICREPGSENFPDAATPDARATPDAGADAAPPAIDGGAGSDAFVI